MINLPTATRVQRAKYLLRQASLKYSARYIDVDIRTGGGFTVTKEAASNYTKAVIERDYADVTIIDVIEHRDEPLRGEKDVLVVWLVSFSATTEEGGRFTCTMQVWAVAEDDYGHGSIEPLSIDPRIYGEW